MNTFIVYAITRVVTIEGYGDIPVAEKNQYVGNGRAEVPGTERDILGAIVGIAAAETPAEAAASVGKSPGHYVAVATTPVELGSLNLSRPTPRRTRGAQRERSPKAL